MLVFLQLLRTPSFSKLQTDPVFQTLSYLHHATVVTPIMPAELSKYSSQFTPKKLNISIVFTPNLRCVNRAEMQ